MPEYNDEKSPYSTEFMIPHRSSTSPPSFDFERLTRFMAYGFLMSPLQFQWFAFLSKSFPITKQSATMPALYRVCFDQLIFAPVGTLCYEDRRAVDCESSDANMSNRSGMFLHLHDHYRGWRTKSRRTQVSRRVPTCAKGKLHVVAYSADIELQSYSIAIPNRKFAFIKGPRLTCA